MAGISLEKMALRELVDLESKLEKAIAAARERERGEVKQKMMALAETSGFSVTELFPMVRASSSRGSKVAVKYRNPDDGSETWTGRGRKPKWLVAKLGKGSKMQDFAI